MISNNMKNNERIIEVERRAFQKVKNILFLWYLTKMVWKSAVLQFSIKRSHFGYGEFISASSGIAFPTNNRRQCIVCSMRLIDVSLKWNKIIVSGWGYHDNNSILVRTLYRNYIGKYYETSPYPLWYRCNRWKDPFLYILHIAVVLAVKTRNYSNITFIFHSAWLLDSFARSLSSW